ncbi:MAG: hypothetical protein J6D23_07415, partial [Clostridia bacterium]|nr:hypothetical protein [Clostridia bacterium]
ERKANEFVQKPYGLNIFPIPMEKTGQVPFDVSIGGDVISMPTVKKAYGKDAFIFRLLNNTDNTVSSYIKINDNRLDLTFGKYEVKTIVYEKGTLTESYELLV